MTTPEPTLRQLKARAQKLKAVIHLGHDGITDALTAALDQALADHGLVKVRFTDHKSERKELSASLATRAGARLVQQAGNIATLYRPPLDQPAAA